MKYSHILITGASSGIGAALASHYAFRSSQHKHKLVLSLCGRNRERLNKVADMCSSFGADVRIKILDVADRNAVKDWIDECDSFAPLDLVIANAGISGGTAKADETIEQVDEIFAINFHGVMNTIYPAIDHMRQRKHGQIAMVSSLAGYRGWAGAPAYCSSKAAVKVYGEALRSSLAKDKIKMSVICPGFVRTPMTDVNHFPMPFKITPEMAVKIIDNGLAKNKSRIAFPWQMSLIVWFFAMLPDSFVQLFMGLIPKKP